MRRVPGSSTGFPYTILRPFNCVGIGERRAVRDTEVMSRNVKLALSHVVPDLVLKVLRGQDPLHILGEGDQVRCYTYGGDLARGIRLALESDAAVNEDFNLSTAVSTTVLELAREIWRKLNGEDRPFRYVSDPPFQHDVQHRVPDVRKAREVLGFEAATYLAAAASLGISLHLGTAVIIAAAGGHLRRRCPGSWLRRDLRSVSRGRRRGPWHGSGDGRCPRGSGACGGPGPDRAGRGGRARG